VNTRTEHMIRKSQITQSIRNASDTVEHMCTDMLRSIQSCFSGYTFSNFREEMASSYIYDVEGEVLMAPLLNTIFVIVEVRYSCCNAVNLIYIIYM
jgi:hypothetical protein